MPVSVFSLFLSITEKEYQTESKRNETFGRVIFGTEAIQETWSRPQGSFKEATRQGGAPYPPGRAPLPRDRLGDPPDLFPMPKIPINIETLEKKPRSGVPPLQASVATKNQSGPCSGTLPEGDPIIGGHLHHPGAIHDEEGVVHPQG